MKGGKVLFPHSLSEYPDSLSAAVVNSLDGDAQAGGDFFGFVALEVEADDFGMVGGQVFQLVEQGYENLAFRDACRRVFGDERRVFFVFFRHFQVFHVVAEAVGDGDV